MKIKGSAQKASLKYIKLVNNNPLESLIVSQFILNWLMEKTLKGLPPDQETLLKYSGVIMRQTTAKLVNLNQLQSELFDNQKQTYSNDQNDTQLSQRQDQPSVQSKQWKGLSVQNQNQRKTINKFNNKKFSQSTPLKQLIKNKAFRIREDEEIHLKKNGIKFVKRQELNSLIKHRKSNAHSSIHNAEFSNQATCQNIGTRKSLYLRNQKPKKKTYFSKGFQNISNKLIEAHPLVKSTKKLSTLPGVTKGNGNDLFNSKQRLFGIMNQSQFVNLKDYYKQKQNHAYNSNSTKKLTKIDSNSNDPDSPSKFSSLANEQSIIRTSQQYNQQQQLQYPYNFQSQIPTIRDEQDIAINKLRQRKQKYYRTGVYGNGDSFTNTRRENNNANNTKPQNNQTGNMLAFDYTGQVLPTFKYDMMKLQAHYQDMDFTINQNDELLNKKKQRKGYLFKGAINLKLVDHQRFIPHPNFAKFEPLVQKPEMLMRENAGYMLKKGVELKAKDDIMNVSTNSATEGQQNKQKIKKASFQFLHNGQIQPNKIKYQQFVRYKKSAQSTTSFNKNLSSRKKLFDLTNMSRQDSLQSKKSMTLQKNKFEQQQDVSNKVYKSQNKRALQLLMCAVNNNNQQDGNDMQIPISLKGQNDSHIRNEQNSKIGGVLKKNNLHTQNRQLLNNKQGNYGQQSVKKKVTIA